MASFLKKHRSILLYGLVITVIFFLHLSYIGNDFVWLDHRDIEAGRAILPLNQLPSAFFTRFADTGFYRPLVAISESVDYAVYKDWAPGYHLTNIFLHVLIIGMLPLFLSLFFSFTFFEVLFVMLIVGVHPFGWLPVGAIAYRPELLVTLFTMITIYLYGKARLTYNSLFGFFAIISFFCALLSKETALIIIPFLVLLWEVMRKKILKKPVSFIFSGGIVLCLYLFLRMQAVPEIWRINGLKLSVGEAVGTRFFIIEKLLLGFINPLKPSLSDAVPVVNVLHISTICFFGVLFSTFILMRKTGFTSQWSKALLLFFILISPALAIIPVPRLGSPHYGYLPLLGFVPFAVLCASFVKKKSIKFQYAIYMFCSVWLVLMTYTTFVSGFQFKNDLTLFTPEIQKDPQFLEGYFYVGNYYLLQNNQLKEAEEAYKKGFQTLPHVIVYSEPQSLLVNLAFVETKRREYGNVKSLLEKQDWLNENPQALLLYANALQHLGKEKELNKIQQAQVQQLMDSFSVDFKNALMK